MVLRCFYEFISFGEFLKFFNSLFVFIQQDLCIFQRDLT